MKTSACGLSVLILVLATCAYIFTRDHGPGVFAAEPEPYYLDRVNELYRENALLMASAFEAELHMSGGGFMYGIEKVGCGYTVVTDSSDISRARRALIVGSTQLLQSINGDELLQPHLKNGRLSINDCKFSMTYHGSADWTGDGLEVAYASIVNGNLVYYRYNSDTEQYDFTFEEPYTEALAIVQREDLSQGNLDSVE